MTSVPPTGSPTPPPASPTPPTRLKAIILGIPDLLLNGIIFGGLGLIVLAIVGPILLSESKKGFTAQEIPKAVNEKLSEPVVPTSSSSPSSKPDMIEKQVELASESPTPLPSPKEELSQELEPKEVLNKTREDDEAVDITQYATKKKDVEASRSQQIDDSSMARMIFSRIKGRNIVTITDVKGGIAKRVAYWNPDPKDDRWVQIATRSNKSGVVSGIPSFGEFKSIYAVSGIEFSNGTSPNINDIDARPGKGCEYVIPVEAGELNLNGLAIDEEQARGIISDLGENRWGFAAFCNP